MILEFKLSMPGNNAWNGKWSGRDNYYAIIKNMGRSKKAENKAKKILEHEYYTYHFGDGWIAGITIKEVNAKESSKLRRKSKGFCGYDWMVDSIIEHDKIITEHERLQLT